MEGLKDLVRQKVISVRSRMVRAAERSGRIAEDVRMVAVSKYANCTDGMIPALVQAGCSILGENRPQILLEKVAAFKQYQLEQQDGPFEWHFIGSLQKNKIRRLLPYVTLIHSIDSISLMETLNRILKEETGQSDESGVAFPYKMKVLLEVNIAKEANKHGFQPERLLEEIPKALSQERIEVVGLMGMGALDATESCLHHQFAQLRELRDECLRCGWRNITELSMGMSDDFEIAIAEGATIVRIGSILYP